MKYNINPVIPKIIAIISIIFLMCINFNDTLSILLFQYFFQKLSTKLYISNSFSHVYLHTFYHRQS